ncbi:hypothetical protein DL93DRAFT_2206726 [Clavulina sp. PMI_390]|nr:hypothetical protein DL93DRAFT_2206726 [Clavulina sp. PMI_390]
MSSFEIQGASYTSGKIKQSGLYRLCITWSPPDIDSVSKVTSQVVKASVDGTVEWAPFSVLRKFVGHLPPHISITVQQRQFKIIWKTLTHDRITTTADQYTLDHIENGFGLNLTITHLAQGMNSTTTAHTTNNQPDFGIHGTLDRGSHNGNDFTMSKPTMTSNISDTNMPAMTSASQQAIKQDTLTPGHHSRSPQDTSHAPASYENVEAKAPVTEQALGLPKNDQPADTSNKLLDEDDSLPTLKNGLLTAFPVVIKSLEGVSKLGGLLEETQTTAQVIIGVLKSAWNIIQTGIGINAHIISLLQHMGDVCEHIIRYETSVEDATVQETACNTLYLVMSGATLINGYTQHRKHGSGFKPSTFLHSFEQDVDNIAQTLASLAVSLTGASEISALHQIHFSGSVLNVIGADVHQLASTLHDGNGHGCLPGTRTAVLEALKTWTAGAPASVILNPVSDPLTESTLDLSSTKVLWLQGVAGSGKSSIAVSVAKFFEHTKVLMAYYRFETAKQGQLNPSNLFTTVALQLAAQDDALKIKLIDLVTSATPLERKSHDPAEQLRLFLLPLLQQNPKAYHHVTIIIDALDESGGVAERSKILKPLVGLAVLLPPAVRILVTTRPESDVQHFLEALPPPECISQLFMNDLPNYSTKQDVHQYVKHMLQHPSLHIKQEHITLLSEKAQLSFQWASTACRYIVDRSDGNQAVRPSKRLRNILSNSATTDRDFSLYLLYTTVLDAQFSHSGPQELNLLRLLLGVLVAARRPLSLGGMLQLLGSHFSVYGEAEDVKEDVVVYFGLLASLVTGIRGANVTTPLLPLHSSFFDFLQDSDSLYCVDVARTHTLLTESCFAVMLNRERGLK